jgi:lipoprotein-anchoring transpeptidase ErfK/SrfK
VHWRPKDYWPADTDVTVDADILGVKLVSPDGNRTLYGRENVRASFHIGESKVAKIDNDTHLMTVWVGGVQVPVVGGRGCDYAGSDKLGCVNGVQLAIRVSLGKDNETQDINGHWHNWRTYTGIQVVTDKKNPQLMTASLPSDDPGYYEKEVVPNAVRITDDGDFIHAADWSLDAQGFRNVSHGCVNVDPADALWFYNLFNPGDVVEIVDTGRPFPATGEGLPDWNKTWDQWLAGSALTSQK